MNARREREMAVETTTDSCFLNGSCEWPVLQSLHQFLSDDAQHRDDTH